MDARFITARLDLRALPTKRRVGALVVVGDAGQRRLDVARRFILFDERLTVGRRLPPRPAAGDADAGDDAGASHWVVPDPLVSSRHLEIVEAAPRRYQLRDLGSTNGTLVDGARVHEPVPLREGAVLFFGQHVAVFRTVGEPDLAALRRELSEPFGPVPLVSPRFVAMTDRLRRLAVGDGEMLIAGETGVGKEIYARAVHRASGRAGAFVAINCAAIPSELVESELFGFVRGAHSEAGEPKPGLIEAAEGGTLFLDEIGEMSPALQSKLLRFAQDRLVTPLGGTRPRRVDVRIVAATNRLDVGAAQERGGGGGVRLDLAVRLGGEALRLPPLRDHIEDLGPLVRHFLAGADRRIAATAFRALCLHAWPGNVRELEKVLQEARALSSEGETIDLEHLPSGIAGVGHGLLASGVPASLASR